MVEMEAKLCELILTCNTVKMFLRVTHFNFWPTLFDRPKKD